MLPGRFATAKSCRSSNALLPGIVSELLAANRVVGFSTYGEQFNAMHVNQTFTGVAIGLLSIILWIVAFASTSRKLFDESSTTVRSSLRPLTT